MTETIRLYNAGKRLIHYGNEKNSIFKPGTAIDFPIAIGKKLQRLYAGEIRTPEDHLTSYIDSTFQGKEISKEVLNEKLDLALIASENKKLEDKKAEFEREKAEWQAKREAEYEAEQRRAQERKESLVETTKENKKESSARTKAKKAMQSVQEEEGEPPLITFNKNAEEII